MKENYDSMDDFVRDFNNEYEECEEYKYIKRIIYPKCPFLYRDIYMNRKEKAYFFDFNGDWYDKNWCKNPLEECEKDAIQEMDCIYKEAIGKIEKSTSNSKNKVVFVVKGTSGKWLKVCKTKEIALKKIKRLEELNNFEGYYYDEEEFIIE